MVDLVGVEVVSEEVKCRIRMSEETAFARWGTEDVRVEAVEVGGRTKYRALGSC